MHGWRMNGRSALLLKHESESAPDACHATFTKLRDPPRSDGLGPLPRCLGSGTGSEILDEAVRALGDEGVPSTVKERGRSCYNLMPL